MPGFRKALLFTSAERYTNLVVNFLLIAVVSRLLSPSEIGVAAFAAVLWAAIEVFRDIPSSYLIQQATLSRTDIRTAFTAMLLITLAVAGALFLGSHRIAALYEDPGLARYIQVLALALLAGPFERTLAALLRREMAFDKLAGINVASALVNATTTIGLALAGFGYMSFAWATLALNATVLLLTIALRPHFWVFRPRLRHWRRALRFGGVAGACSLLSQGAEMLPYFFLSHFYRFDAAGYYNRALQVSQAPAKLLLSGLSPVILPAFARHAREGQKLKGAFLLAISHISVVYWPAFVLLAILSYPAVAILVGPQWVSIVPLVQIVALAMLFSFASILIFPMLMAANALRDLLMWHVIAMPATMVINGTAAIFGLMPLALSLLITMPLQNFTGLSFVRRHAGFTWGEFWRACRGSIVIAVCTNAVPALYIIAHGFRFEVSIPVGIVLGFTAVISWFAAVWATGHPMRRELSLGASALRRHLLRPVTVAASAAPQADR